METVHLRHLEGDGEIKDDEQADIDPKKVTKQRDIDVTQQDTNNEFGEAAIVIPKKKKEKKKEISEKPIAAPKRELTKITIVSIGLTDVVAAHRVAKNSLWLKCSVANVNFSVDSNGALTGSQNEWLGLEWSFIRARNVEDRTDLVITVGSKGVVIGKYVLYSTEFDDIPSTSSGYFEITGEISSEVGPSGQIRLVCRREVAERPTQAKPSTLQDLVHPPTIILPPMSKLYLRIIRITLSNLKSVHVLEKNSPCIRVQCGRWEKHTSVLIKAGKAAMWDRLPWRVLTEPRQQVKLTVYSVATLVGDISLTMGELAASKKADESESGFPEIFRQLTDGSDVVGEVKILFDLSVDFPANRESISNYKDIREDNIEAEKSSSSLNKYALKEKLTDNNKISTISGGTIGVINKAKPNTVVEKEVVDNRKSYSMSFPFMLHVTSIAVLDTPKLSFFQSNALRVHIACGADGHTSTIIKSSGRSAQWSGLGWKFLVREKSKLRITVWSRTTVIGQVVLDEHELIDKPCDTRNFFQMLLKLFNGDKYVGKINILCQYAEVLKKEPTIVVVASDKTKFHESHVDNASTTTLGNNESNNTIINKVLFEQTNASAGVAATSSGSGQQLEFPLLATVVSISLFDLYPVHRIMPNSPRVKLRCDRKCAYTKLLRFAGAEAYWDKLDWPVPVNLGSDISITVFSNTVIIGAVEISPESLLTLPRGENNTVELFCSITKKGKFAGNIRMFFRLKSMDWQTFRELFAAGPVGQYLLEGSEGAPMFDPTTTPSKNNKNNSTNNGSSVVSNLSRPSSSTKMSAKIGPANVPTNNNNSTTTTGSVNKAPRAVFEDISHLILNAKARAAHGFALQLDVIEIDVSELIPVHMFQKNSPFVAAACGRWEDRTKALLYSGSEGYWSSVGWSIRFKEDSILHVVVGSGERTIGVTYIEASKIVGCPLDKAGVRRLMSTLIHNDHTAGRIKLTYVIEVVKETPVLPAIGDKKKAGVQKKDRVELLKENMMTVPNLSAEEQHQESLKKLAASVRDRQAVVEEEVEPFLQRYPLSAVVHEIKVSKLNPAHACSKNSPCVSIFCGDWSASTQVRRDAGEESVSWSDLNWIIPLMEEFTPLRITVRSFTVTIGSATTNGNELVTLKQKNADFFELHKNLTNGIGETGKITITLKLLPGKVYNRPSGFPVSSTGAVDMLSTMSESLGPLSQFISPTKNREPLWLPPVSATEAAAQQSLNNNGEKNRDGKKPEEKNNKFQIDVVNMVDQLDVANAAAAIQAAEQYKKQKKTEEQLAIAMTNLPIELLIHGIALIELKSVHTLASNSPLISMVCGKWADCTTVATNAGKAALWNNLNWQFELNDENASSVGIVVTSQKETIGTVAFSAMEFIAARSTSNNDGISRVIGDIKMKDKVSGKIKIVYELIPLVREKKAKDSKKKNVFAGITVVNDDPLEKLPGTIHEEPSQDLSLLEEDPRDRDRGDSKDELDDNNEVDDEFQFQPAVKKSTPKRSQMKEIVSNKYSVNDSVNDNQYAQQIGNEFSTPSALDGVSSISVGGGSVGNDSAFY